MAEWILGYLLRAGALVLVATVGLKFLGKTSPSIRHLFCAIALLAGLSLPLLESVVPSLWTERMVEPTMSVTIVDVTGRPQTATPAEAQPLDVQPIPAVYLLGLLVGLTGALRSMVVGARVRRELVADDGTKRSLLDELAREVGVSPRRVRLAFGSIQPFVMGAFRATIALPVEAIDWPEDRLRSVLTHELAHVRRCDVLWQLLARAATALQWPNPLAWILARRMRFEAELAADELVLRNGKAPVEYAADLVQTVRVAKECAPASAFGLVSVSDLERRVKHILGAQASKPATLGQRLLCLGGLLASAAGLASLTPARETITLQEPRVQVDSRPLRPAQTPLRSVSPEAGQATNSASTQQPKVATGQKRAEPTKAVAPDPSRSSAPLPSGTRQGKAPEDAGRELEPTAPAAGSATQPVETPAAEAPTVRAEGDVGELLEYVKPTTARPGPKSRDAYLTIANKTYKIRMPDPDNAKEQAAFYSRWWAVAKQEGVESMTFSTEPPAGSQLTQEPPL